MAFIGKSIIFFGNFEITVSKTALYNKSEKLSKF